MYGFPNFHATALILSLDSFDDKGLDFLIDQIDNNFDDIINRVTPYFSYFVAKALKLRCNKNIINFIKKYYDPIIKHMVLYMKNVMEIVVWLLNDD